MQTQFSISDLSREFGITTRTLRFYEEKGLVRPKRDGQNRIYSAADRIRLRLILRGKRLGFTLEESQGIIEMYDSQTDNKKQLQALIAKIRDKHQILKQQQADLKAMMLDLRTWEKRCLASLANDSEQTSLGKN
jgi:DNA-binding transcriptional MerR regulator